MGYKKNDKKAAEKTENKEERMWRDVALTLAAWEVKESKNCDILRCSAYAGKDSDGNYQKDVPVSVIIGKDTDTEHFDFDQPEEGKKKRILVDVSGQISFSWYKDTPQITIFAARIVTRK